MRISQTTLESRLAKTRADKLADVDQVYCQSCESYRNLELSHLVSRDECKKYDLLELFYAPGNNVWHCNDFANGCHRHWENGTKKGLDWAQNMEFIKANAPPELYNIILNKWQKHF